MPMLMLSLALLLVPSVTYAHPGKTDPRGGHRCLKDCAEWDLYYQEYHLHDKDGKVIKVAQQRPDRSPIKAPKPLADAAGPVTLPAATVQAASIAPAPVEDERPFDVRLLWLLVLLLLAFLLVRRIRAWRAG